MALIKCPECGRQVSDRASACPDCAFPLQNRRSSFLRGFVAPPFEATHKTGRSGPKLAYAPFCLKPTPATPLAQLLGNQSFSFGNTHLDHKGLFHDGKHWDISRVHFVAIRFANVDYRTNGVFSMGTAIEGQFIARFDDGSSVSFKASGPWTNFTIGSVNRRNQPAFVLAHAICHVTYEARIYKYLHQLDELGYFAYDSAAFYHDGTVVKGNREANARRDKIIKYVNRYQLDIVVPKSKLAGAFNKVYNQDITIDTHIDRDVFFGLFEHIYGRKWE